MHSLPSCRQGLSFLAIVLVFITSLSACGSKKSDSKATASPIPDGTYTAAAPKCADTNTEPEYTSVGAAAALRNFSDAVHSFVLAGTKLTETVKSTTCQLVIDQTVYKNDGVVFQPTQGVVHTFTPAACTLTVTLGGTAVAVDKGYGSGLVFKDSTSTEPSMALAVVQSSTTMEVTTQAIGGLGCGNVGKFKWIWTKN